MKFITISLLTILILSILSSTSCAVNRVILNKKLEVDGVQARVILMNSSELMELVISMQEPGHSIRERVFRINWTPDIIEIGDFNNDSIMDVKIISTSAEVHYFWGTERAFIYN